MSQSQVKRQLNRTETLDYTPQNIPSIEIPSPFSFTALAFFFFGLVLLLLVIVGLIKNWSMLTASTSILIQVLILLCIVALPLILISVGIQKGYLAYVTMRQAKIDLLVQQETLEALRDQRQRDNERHQMELYLLESRLPADERGNRAGIFDRQTGEIIIPPSGNFIQAVPNHYAPKIEINTSSTQAEQNAANQTQVTPAPSIDYALSLLRPNGLEVCLGTSLTTGKPFVLPLLKGVHYKLLGGSGFGKSCGAASMLYQATQTNDPDHLLIALLDLEHKTSRLFENLPHVAELQVGKKHIPIIGRDADEVAQMLGYLKKELDRRAKLDPAALQQERFLLIYVEEFLSLKFEVDEDLKEQMLKDFSILAVRGRKYGMYFLACAQTDYADDDLKEAKGQFRVREAYCIDPPAARSAGFIRTDLIKQNYQAQTPGQFVLETSGCIDLMIAPQFDVEQKLLQMQHTPSLTPYGVSTVSPATPRPTIIDSHLPNTQVTPLVTPTLAPALEAKLQAILQLQEQGYTNQAEIIEKIWGVKKGTNAKFYTAKAEYDILTNEIEHRKALQQAMETEA
jgi:hypothetical protein